MTSVFMTDAAALPVLRTEWGMSGTAAGSISTGFQRGYAVARRLLGAGRSYRRAPRLPRIGVAQRGLRARVRRLGAVVDDSRHGSGSHWSGTMNIVKLVAWLFVTLLVGLGLAIGIASAQGLRLGAPAPDVAGGRWVNSEPLTTQGLRGRVVLVEFWTYG
jgi:hypothetical protein